MAIIDCVSWSPQGSEIIFAYKFPQDNLSTYTQLIVNESQVALLFSKGQLLGKFGPGKHTLSTENLPILRNLFGLPFGGKNPFTAQVWFVNLVQSFSIPYILRNLPVHDPDYNTYLPLAVEGQYGLKVEDPEKFVIKMVGTRNVYTQADLTEQFEGEFATKGKSAIAQFMLQNKVGFKSISAFLDPLSSSLRMQINEFVEQLGLELTKFYISSIDIDTSTPEGVKIKESLATQGSMSITGHTWQQEQMFGTANNAIGQMGGAFGGSGGGLLGGLMAMQMMNGMGAGMGGGAAMNPQFQQPTFGPGDAGQGGAAAGGGVAGVKMVYCSNCAKKFPSSMEFCPNCGNKYNPCPNCGSDNPKEAKRCVSCGTPLAGAPDKCPHCRTEIPAGCAFCPGCGQPVISADNVCSQCGSQIPPTARFCPKCGKKR